MNAFLEQIKEDIKDIQRCWGEVDIKLNEDSYAFNHWVLSYLYNIDDVVAQDNIVEYKDKGLDCWVHFKDTKELYLFQNKYYIKTEHLDAKEVSYFLESPLTSLVSGTYSRSTELQQIYNKYVKDDEDYTVYLYLYITKPKDSISSDIFNLFSVKNNTVISGAKHVIEAKLIDIEETHRQYDSDRKQQEQNLDLNIPVFGAGKNYISQDPEQRDRESNVKTMYAEVGVWDIYKTYCNACQKEYDIFDKNIREYLGVKIKTNKQMYNTLIDKNEEGERNRFFYYNNGITMICSEIGSPKKVSKDRYEIPVKKPQIVNGCQTVNTIVRAIEDMIHKYGELETQEKFTHSSVLVKMYEVADDNTQEGSVYEKIVRNTNTQTGVKMKDFSSKNKYFLELQNDFLKRGFYLLVKSSDSNKFKNDSGLFDDMKQRSLKLCEIFGKTIEKPEDLFIDISMFLKALAAFVFDGYIAFSEGASTLKENSSTYYINFSKKIREFFTTDNMISLYLLYCKSGGIKRGREERYPIPYYMMDFIGRFIKYKENNEWDFKYINSKLNYLFSSKEIFDEIYEQYRYINEDYGSEFCKKNNVDYATMTKARKIDNELIRELFNGRKKEAERRKDIKFLEYIK